MKVPQNCQATYLAPMGAIVNAMAHILSTMNWKKPLPEGTQVPPTSFMWAFANFHMYQKNMTNTM